MGNEQIIVNGKSVEHFLDQQHTEQKKIEIHEDVRTPLFIYRRPIKGVVKTKGKSGKVKIYTKEELKIMDMKKLETSTYIANNSSSSLRSLVIYFMKYEESFTTRLIFEKISKLRDCNYSSIQAYVYSIGRLIPDSFDISSGVHPTYKWKGSNISIETIDQMHRDFYNNQRRSLQMTKGGIEEKSTEKLTDEIVSDVITKDDWVILGGLIEKFRNNGYHIKVQS